MGVTVTAPAGAGRVVGALLLAACTLLVVGCGGRGRPTPPPPPGRPYLVVLGTAQDGGFPQANCQKACCRRVARGELEPSPAVSLGLVDPRSGGRWILDATPDLPAQLRRLDELAEAESSPDLDGVFLTHAHIGHYTGLVHLGREVTGAAGVPVYAMPRMREFLAANGPWDQLVRLENIAVEPLEAGQAIELAPDLSVTPFLVPHRDEYTETVGFLVSGPERAALFLPDIDKWERWSTRIEDMIASVDAAFLDGTFYSDEELPGRDMSEIPHPFIVESLARFETLPADERAKVRFIHLNHTNPALDPDSPEARKVREAGFWIAVDGEILPL